MKFYEIKANLVLPDSDEVDKSCGYYFELPLDENMLNKSVRMRQCN